jgi:cyclic beta-1,2-glucan synthetase
MHRVALEGLLGIAMRGGTHLAIDPCIPAAWRGFTVTLRRGAAEYVVVVENPHGAERGVAAVELDGRRLEQRLVPLADDGARHEVRVTLARPAPVPADAKADVSR